MTHEYYDLVVLGGGIVGLWTATQAARLGASVAVVEIGAGSLAAQRAADPPIAFSNRENGGAVRARNQVLGGNGSYWGGGLVRNAPTALADLYGSDVADKVYARYESVERTLGVGDAFEQAPLKLEGEHLHEVAVLPGKKRGLWANVRDGKNLRLFLDARITGVKRSSSGTIDAIDIRDAHGEEQSLCAPQYALSMGVIDSNLFVQDWLKEGNPPAISARVGTCLHDHWSVPIAKLRWRNGTSLGVLFPPKFKGGVVAGRRVTLENGFFHIVADLDAMPPYDRVKELLRVRQQGAGPLAIINAALRTCANPWGMTRAGVHYLAKRQLFIPDGSSVRLVLDFESSRSERNRIIRTGAAATLDWDFRDSDFDCFEHIVREHRAFWTLAMASSQIEAEWLFDEHWSSQSMRSHLSAAGTDAYHLGGGLHPDYQQTSGPSEISGCLRGCSNLFINGTAFFCRPGPGNPVLTLLARADVYVDDLSKGDVVT